MCFFFDRSNSAVTLVCRIIEPRPPFWCFAVTFWWNFDLTAYVFHKAILEKNLGNCDAIAWFILHVEISILLTFSLLLHHCQTKTTKKVPSDDEFVDNLPKCKACVFTYPIVIDNSGWNFAEDLDRFIWKTSEVFLKIEKIYRTDRVLCKIFWPKYLCLSCTHTNRVDHRVSGYFSELNFCIEWFKMIRFVIRDSGNIAIGITLGVRVIYSIV